MAIQRKSDKSDETDVEDEDDKPSKSKSAEPAPAPKKAKAAPPPVEEEEEEEESGDEEESDESDSEEESESETDGESESETDSEEESETDDLAAREGDVLPSQLGIQRYVFSAYFAAAALMAYVIGRAIHDIWAHYASRDFFVNFSAAIAGVPDDDSHILNKRTYALAIGVVISLIVMIRLYRKPSFRQWIDEVTGELAKCRWPTRKEVTTSTIVVLAASAASTAYLFILDRLWAFITSLVYGTGT